ncbi:hypothetical protein HU200_057363 [Digitaria exilis]|uniref:Uncharacterized protein n=1 Tax=Digitaria exilis TaxID=1010633 RepID=A0A835AFF7_9POAL|nr:hypothetical protein HU200_057363 [Digitaria exilis]
MIASSLRAAQPRSSGGGALAMVVSDQPGAEPGSPSASGRAMSSLLAAVEAEVASRNAVAGPPQVTLAGAREEPPPCLRDHILPMLNLPTNLPAHFISEKSIKLGDVDPRQNRIYLGDEDGSVARRLREILIHEELSSFDPFHHEDDPPQPGIVEAAGQGRAKRMKTAWEYNCGLDVTLVSHCIGAVDARLLRRRSGAVVIRGRGYLEENDVVEIWAFRKRGVPGGMAVCGEGTLHVLIAKKEDRTLCSHCSLLMCSHYTPDSHRQERSPEFLNASRSRFLEQSRKLHVRQSYILINADES